MREVHEKTPPGYPKRRSAALLPAAAVHDGPDFPYGSAVVNCSHPWQTCRFWSMICCRTAGRVQSRDTQRPSTAHANILLSVEHGVPES